MSAFDLSDAEAINCLLNIKNEKGIAWRRPSPELIETFRGQTPNKKGIVSFKASPSVDGAKSGLIAGEIEIVVGLSPHFIWQAEKDKLMHHLFYLRAHRAFMYTTTIANQGTSRLYSMMETFDEAWKVVGGPPRPDDPKRKPVDFIL